MALRLSLFLLLALNFCGREDPRIAEAEAVADTVCDCTWLGCAVDAARPLIDRRGLEQEDYATLDDDLIARYHAAHDRAQACVQALIFE